jgi:predicted thioesterase
MKCNPKIGDLGELTFVVTNQHVIDFAEEQMPAVLCTPWLIWFLEHAALQAVLPCLDPIESSVGTHVDVQHLAPTPIGHEVSCRARVIQSDGPIISFQLEARDEQELIARGLHKRRVIRCDRFSSRVQAKAANRE